MENLKGIILAFVVALFIGAGGYLAMDSILDSQEQKELEIYFNGTNQGAANVINWINETKAVPVFLEDGDVGYIKFTQLCDELNDGGQS